MGRGKDRRSALDTDGFGYILAAAKAGEAWAFEYLFGLLARPVAGFLRARGAPDWEGLANEVMLRAFRSIGRFDGDAGGYRSWVFAIARNALIDEQRGARARLVMEPMEPADLPEPPDVFPGGGAELNDPLVAELLGELPDEQREVLLLRVVADLSVEETAQVMGKTAGAVKALQHRALRRLRKKLSKEA